MNRRFVIVSAIAFACSRASGQMPATVAVANDPMLQHHEIRIDQLPKPFATPSSGNPPTVGAPPANATLERGADAAIEHRAATLAGILRAGLLLGSGIGGAAAAAERDGVRIFGQVHRY